ncbi:MAG: hypothetical protein V1735_04455 [Nanoarchaeota archaeon]
MHISRDWLLPTAVLATTAGALTMYQGRNQIIDREAHVPQVVQEAMAVDQALADINGAKANLWYSGIGASGSTEDAYGRLAATVGAIGMSTPALDSLLNQVNGQTIPATEETQQGIERVRAELLAMRAELRASAGQILDKYDGQSLGDGAGLLGGDVLAAVGLMCIAGDLMRRRREHGLSQPSASYGPLKLL